jgi:hypothetical protein
MMQFVEIAEMQYSSGNLQPWEKDVADEMIDWGREAVETLLVLAGHLQAELGKNWEPRSWSPLPIAVRGWCIRDPKTSRKRKKNLYNQGAKKSGNRKPNFDNRRPSGFVCIGDPPQGTASLLGVVLFGVTAGWRITQETLVYPNDIGAEELKTLERYVRERTRDKTILGDDDELKQCSV